MTAWKTMVPTCHDLDSLSNKYSCQSYSACKALSDGSLVGALASGVKISPYSFVGAELAVKCAVTYLRLAVQSHFFELMTEEKGFTLFSDLRHFIHDKLYQVSQATPCPLENLGCTLLAIVVTDQGIGAMQIGDGLLVIRTEKGPFQLLFAPTVEALDEPVTLTSSPHPENNIQVKVLHQPISFLCAATDECMPLARGAALIPDLSLLQPLQEFLQHSTHPGARLDWGEPFLLSELDRNLWVHENRALLVAQRS